ncbi:MAG TPA: DMT family transporter [Alphaproteobacteria bacterium]
MPSAQPSTSSGAALGRWLLDPYVCAVLGMLIWATGYVLVRDLRADAPAVWIAFWRNTVALAIFVAIAFPRIRRDLPAIIAGWKPLARAGFLMVVSGNAAMTIGLTQTTVVNASIINASEPMIIIVFGWLMYRTRITVRQAAGIALSLAGVLFLVVRGDPAVLGTLEVNSGDLWCLVAIISWSLYAAGIRRLPLGDRPFSQTIAITFFGELFLLPWFAWDEATRPAFQITADAMLGVVYLGLIASVVALSMWIRALNLLGPTRASPFVHLLPVFGIILGIVVLGEPMFSYHAVGIALIALGIYLTSAVRAKLPANTGERA